MILKYQQLRESGLTVFDRRAIANILGLKYASTNPVLDRLTKKGILVRLKRDCYAFPDALESKSRKIANELIKPSYISLWTALNDVGMTTQSPRVVQSITTKRSQTIDLEDGYTFTYSRFPEKLFFGYEVTDNKTLCAKPEKALLDIMYIQKTGFDWQSIDRKALDAGRMQKMVQPYPERVKIALQSFLSTDDDQ